MKTTQQLNDRFAALNKEYVKIDKKLNKIFCTTEARPLYLRLEEIQEEMSKIATQLEELEK